MKRFNHSMVADLISLAVLISGTPTPVRSQKKIIKIDGSRPIYPIPEAVVEEFKKMAAENLLSSADNILRVLVSINRPYEQIRSAR